MKGNPADFEAIGNRLGFHIASENPQRLILIWKGARFPAFLCLGIAVALFFLSVPIIEAIRQTGFTGPAGSLWYFPVMNLILFGIAIFLVSIRRTILIDDTTRRILLAKRSLFRNLSFCVDYEEVSALRLGIDEVYSGFAVAGSTAGQRFPASALRLILNGGKTVLLDRGGRKRLESLGKHLGERLGKSLQTDEALLMMKTDPVGLRQEPAKN